MEKTDTRARQEEVEVGVRALRVMGVTLTGNGAEVEVVSDDLLMVVVH